VVGIYLFNSIQLKTGSYNIRNYLGASSSHTISLF